MTVSQDVKSTEREVIETMTLITASKRHIKEIPQMTPLSPEFNRFNVQAKLRM